MHPSILEVRRRARAGLAALGVVMSAAAWAHGAAVAPDPDCPSPARTLVEHFIAGDCDVCWQAAAGSTAPGTLDPGDTGWALDWIAPATDGRDPPALPEALPESIDRLARLDPHLPARLQVAPAGFEVAETLSAPSPGRRLIVHSSLPYRGYFGVQMHATGQWPAGATGWMALVESLRADTAGSALARHVVRSVTGPLTLPAAPGAAHTEAPLVAMRWPATARLDRVMAVAWIEGADGRVLQITSDRCRDAR